MAIKSSWDSPVGLRARRPPTVKRCAVDARSEAQPGHPTMRGGDRSGGGRGAWKKVCLSAYRLILAVSFLSLVACAGSPEPMLRSNAKLQLQGRDAAKLDVADCQKKAEAAGLKPGTSNRSGNVAAGATLGLIAVQNLLDLQRPIFDAMLERLAIEILHGDERLPIVLTDLVNR